MFSFDDQSEGMSFPSRGIPSRTHRGSVFPLSVTVLRILTLLAPPGAPVVGVEVSPAMDPESISSTLATPSREMSAILTLAIEEVSFRFSMRWYPVTTTASTRFSAGESRIVKLLFPAMSTVCASYPR